MAARIVKKNLLAGARLSVTADALTKDFSVLLDDVDPNNEDPLYDALEKSGLRIGLGGPPLSKFFRVLSLDVQPLGGRSRTKVRIRGTAVDVSRIRVDFSAAVSREISKLDYNGRILDVRWKQDGTGYPAANEGEVCHAEATIWRPGLLLTYERYIVASEMDNNLKWAFAHPLRWVGAINNAKWNTGEKHCWMCTSMNMRGIGPLTNGFFHCTAQFLYRGPADATNKGAERHDVVIIFKRSHTGLVPQGVTPEPDQATEGNGWRVVQMTAERNFSELSNLFPDLSNYNVGNAVKERPTP